MRCSTRILSLTLLIAAAAIGTTGQQPSQDEFVSIVGRFGIMLPSQYAEFRANTELSVAGETLKGSMYRWVLDSDHLVVSYATATGDLEPKADVFLKALRDNLQKSSQGKVVSEKSTTLSGHPGRELVLESNGNRAMAWTYLFKNRVYLISLTATDATKTEEHVKLISTFRFVNREELQPRYAKVIEALTPPALPADPPVNRPTTDAQDAALKGPVKQILTEKEQAVGTTLLGERDLVSLEDFDQRGNLTRRVEYLDQLPHAVRTYGHVNGNRVFREIRKFPNVVMPVQGRHSSIVQVPGEPKDFIVKHKHDNDGRLLELRIFTDTGSQFEARVYSSNGKRLEHTYHEGYEAFGPMFGKSTKVSKLDDNGNPVETSERKQAGTRPNTRTVGGQIYTDREAVFRTETAKHEYELDVRGNWIKRITKDSVRGPSVTYRTITYYQ